MREIKSTDHDYSENIADAIKNHFDQNNWNYTFDEDNGVFKASMNIGGKMNIIHLSLYTHNDAFTVYFTLPLCADKKVRIKIAEFITRANYRMLNGNFEMDFSDGEIRFKVYVPLQTEVPSDDAIGLAIFIGIKMIRRHANGLLEVMFGFNTPEKAIENIMLNNIIDDDDDDDDIDIDDDDDDDDDDDIDDDDDDDIDDDDDDIDDDDDDDDIFGSSSDSKDKK